MYQKEGDNDAIYYILGANKCVKIHTFNKKVYFDLRSFRKTEDGKIDVDIFKPEPGNLKHALKAYKNPREDEVIRGRGISLLIPQAKNFVKSLPDIN